MRGAPMDGARHARQLQDRLQLGGEHELVPAIGVVQGLDAEAIAGKKQLLPPLVPDGKREHPAEPIDTASAEIFVEVNDGFGVAAGLEHVATTLEIAAQLAVVVDLPVEDNPDGPVFVGDRLMAAREVDDAQPAHAERHAVTEIHPLVVRTAVHDRGAHAADVRLRYRSSIPAHDSGNAAHRYFPPSGASPVTARGSRRRARLRSRWRIGRRIAAGSATPRA